MFVYMGLHGTAGQDRLNKRGQDEDRTEQYRSEQGNIGQDRSGQGRTWQDRTGQDREGQDRAGQCWTLLDREENLISLGTLSKQNCTGNSTRGQSKPKKIWAVQDK